MAFVFAGNAPAMRQQGLAVLPIGCDREPCISGFNKWRARPGARRVEEWCKRFGNANIAVLPGLSGRHGATVLDCDTKDAALEIEERFGKTPLQTITRRGRHLWFAKVSARLPGNLRRYGLEVDIKSGNQIVIAPPSVHETGHIYQLCDADWSTLDRLPPLDLDALWIVIGNRGSGFRNSQSEARQEDRPLRPIVTKGERASTLNSCLVKHAFDCETFNRLLDLAQTFNRDFAPPLESDEVAKVAAKVWRDKVMGKIEPLKGVESMQKRWRTELHRLCDIDPKRGADAYALLLVLRDEHSVRCRRGETFAISPAAMAIARVIPGWTRERYEKSRDLLIEARLLFCEQSFRRNSTEGRSAGKFKLAMPQHGGAAAGGV